MLKSALLSLITATLLLLAPGFAAAKGSKLRFIEEQYAPGDRALAHAIVETWPGSGQPGDAPFTVYLVRGSHPLYFGHLPNRAIPIGMLRIGHQVLDRTEVGDTYRVSVDFDVPRVSDGRYAVWVCAPANGGNGCWIGFGDLVYGHLIVARKTGGAASADPGGDAVQERPNAESATSLGDSIPWAGVGLVVAAVAAMLALLVLQKRSRHSPFHPPSP